MLHFMDLFPRIHFHCFSMTKNAIKILLKLKCVVFFLGLLYHLHIKEIKKKLPGGVYGTSCLVFWQQIDGLLFLCRIAVGILLIISIWKIVFRSHKKNIEASNIIKKYLILVGVGFFVLFFFEFLKICLFIFGGGFLWWKIEYRQKKKNNAKTCRLSIDSSG